MNVVVDASVVVAALVDTGPEGRWAEEVMIGQLAAPHLMPVEVANILRRMVLAGDLSTAEATMAHSDVLRMRVQLFDYSPFAERVWSLRNNITAYDAWYVAVAEQLGVALATLDRRLSMAPGTTCEFLGPDPGR